MQESIAAERLDENGKTVPSKSINRVRSTRKAKKRRTDFSGMQASSDEEDEDFSASNSESESGGDVSAEEVTNEEVCLSYQLLIPFFC
jgi:hypothetical protein